MSAASAGSRTVALSAEGARALDNLLARGGYASESEALEAGLRALGDRAEALEHWLTEDVAPVYDAMMRDPGRGLSADAVAASLAAHHAARRPGGA
jgi:antitoxin ParD1/3/4